MTNSIGSTSLNAKPIPYERQGAEPSVGVFRDGKNLVIKRGSDISPFCFCCGRPAIGKGIRKHLVSKTDRGGLAGAGGIEYASGVIGAILFVIYIIMLVATLVNAVRAWSNSRERTIIFGLCEKHRRRRIIQKTVALMLCFGGVIASAGGSYIACHATPAMGPGVMILMYGLLGGAILWLAAAGIAATIASPVMVSEQGDWLWVKGACEALLRAQPSMLAPEPVDGPGQPKATVDLNLDLP